MLRVVLPAPTWCKPTALLLDPLRSLWQRVGSTGRSHRAELCGSEGRNLLMGLFAFRRMKEREAAAKAVASAS